MAYTSIQRLAKKLKAYRAARSRRWIRLFIARIFGQRIVIWEAVHGSRRASGVARTIVEAEEQAQLLRRTWKRGQQRSTAVPQQLNLLELTHVDTAKSGLVRESRPHSGGPL